MYKIFVCPNKGFGLILSAAVFLSACQTPPQQTHSNTSPDKVQSSPRETQRTIQQIKCNSCEDNAPNISNNKKVKHKRYDPIEIELK